MTAGRWGVGTTSKAGRDQKQMEAPRRWAAHLSAPP